MNEEFLQLWAMFTTACFIVFTIMYVIVNLSDENDENKINHLQAQIKCNNPDAKLVLAYQDGSANDAQSCCVPIKTRVYNTHTGVFEFNHDQKCWFATMPEPKEQPLEINGWEIVKNDR